ncbi:MAG: hypothetical protein ACLQLG_10730 [Thermoguttaceae bacterium]
MPFVSAPNADEPFLVELRYTVPFDGRSLDLPFFPDEVALQKVYLCVYVPAPQALLGSVGPWSEEFQWRLDGLHWEPCYPAADTSDDKKLVSWVEQGTGPAGSASFLPDGRRFVFSTLRPSAPPDGSLRLRLLSNNGLSAIVFLVVVCGGLILLPAGRGRRAAAVGAVIIALVLSGVFCPTFAMQIVNGVLAAALVIVLVVWSVAYMARSRPAAAATARPMPPPAATALDAGVSLSAPPAAAPAAAEPPPATPPETPPPSPEQAPKAESEGGQTNV